MAKRCRTDKYRKQRRKELANRKTKRLVAQEAEQLVAPVSAARKAFEVYKMKEVK